MVDLGENGQDFKERRAARDGSPKKFLIWLAAISIAAPAVKPITTVCEMKLTSTPMRARPRINWNMPVMNVRVSTMLMNSGSQDGRTG